MGFDRAQIVRQDRETLLAAIEIAQGGRQGGAPAGRPLHRIGKLGRMGRRQGHHRDVGVQPDRAGGGQADGAMGIDQFAGFAMECCHGCQGLPIVLPVAGENLAQAVMLAGVERQPSALAELSHGDCQPRPVAAEEVEQQPLGVAGNLDIHAGA